MAEVPTSWQDAETVKSYLEERRAAIPFGEEMLTIVGQLIGLLAREVNLFADLGAGDGFFAQLVLERFPKARAILIDHSQPMLAKARTNLGTYGDQVSFVEADLGNPITKLVPPGSLDLVVSRFAIHHLPDARKYSIYQEVFQLLRPGGIFLHNEHVSSASRELESLSDSIFIARIAQRTGREVAVVEREFFARPDRLDNKLAPVEIQVAWLRDLGFEGADCYFKWLELAVFGGRKPQQ